MREGCSIEPQQAANMAESVHISTDALDVGAKTMECGLTIINQQQSLVTSDIRLFH